MRSEFSSSLTTISSPVKEKLSLPVSVATDIPSLESVRSLLPAHNPPLDQIAGRNAHGLVKRVFVLTFASACERVRARVLTHFHAETLVALFALVLF